jgi:hypothetical protein
LDLACGDIVWASTSIVTVIVDIEIVAARSLLPDVLDRCDYVERLSRRYLADGLTDLRCILKPYALNRQVRCGGGMNRNRETRKKKQDNK